MCFRVNKSNKKKKSRKRKRSKPNNNAGGVSATVSRILRPPPVALPERVEVKYFDTEQAIVAVTTAGLVNKLSAVSQGASVSQRIGDEYQPIALEMRLRAIAVAGNISVIRMVVFQWNISDSVVAPTLLGVLKTPVTATGYPLAPYNIQNVEQQVFSVLMDRLLDLNPNGQNSVDASRVLLKLKGSVRCDAAAVTGQGMLYIVFVSDQAAGGPSVAFTSRLLFTDA